MLRFVVGMVGLASWTLGTACTAPEDFVADQPETYARWVGIEELRLGGLDDPDYSFGPIAHVAVGDRGDIYTSHPQERQIRQWAPDGSLASVIGGRGRGPGEFVDVTSIGVIEDTVWVLDHGALRVTLFDEGGAVVRTIPIEIDRRGQLGDPARGRPRPMHLLADGSFYGFESSLIPQMVARDSTQVLHLRLDTRSAVLDTIFIQARRPEDVLAVQADDGQWLTAAQSFADGVLTDIDPSSEAFVIVRRPAFDGLAPATFGVVRASLAGDTLFERTVQYRPVPVDDAIVDRVVASIAEQWNRRYARAVGRSDFSSLVRGALYTPHYHPPVAAVVMGRDGTIWLRGPLPAQGRVEWTVLDERGGPLARVDLPASLVIRVADRHTVWGVERDRRGVDYLRRLRLEARSEGT